MKKLLSKLFHVAPVQDLSGAEKFVDFSLQRSLEPRIVVKGGEYVFTQDPLLRKEYIYPLQAHLFSLFVIGFKLFYVRDEGVKHSEGFRAPRIPAGDGHDDKLTVVSVSILYLIVKDIFIIMLRHQGFDGVVYLQLEHARSQDDCDECQNNEDCERSPYREIDVPIHRLMAPPPMTNWEAFDNIIDN